MKKKMLINVADEEESRVAIVEDGTLEEFTIEVSSKEQIKGNMLERARRWEERVRARR